MAQILHGTNGLIKLPGRAITQVDDGIVQLTCSFACKTSLAGTFRALFANGEPVPDEPGFIIKNGVTETTRGDGFTEFSVTATGETKSGGSFGREDLKAQSDVSVQNFPSGLIRVEQKFVCRTENESRFSQNLVAGSVFPESGAFSVDRLYIYPNPSIIRRSDGFTEFNVTAYGRKEIAPRPFERQTIKSTYTIERINAEGENVTTTAPSLNETYTIRYVIESSLPASAALVAPEVEDPVVLKLNGTPLQKGQRPLGATTINNVNFEIINDISINLVLDSLTSANFGYWTEYTVVYKAEAIDRLNFNPKG